MPPNPDPDRYGNDDLTGIVRNLCRRQEDRLGAALVNHIYTRAFLEAGMRLVSREFHRSGQSEDAFPAFNSLHRKELIAEAADDDPALTLGRFRYRWLHLRDYLGDLIRYALRSARWSPHFLLLDRYSSVAERGDLIDAAQRIAYEDLDLVTNNSAAMRFQFVVTAFAARDGSNAEALTTAYDSVLERWRSFYESIIERRGLALRRGVSVADVTGILHAAMEGFSLRLLGDPRADVVDISQRRSQLGMAAVAIMAACVDRGDGLSLEEFARQAYGGQVTP